MHVIYFLFLPNYYVRTPSTMLIRSPETGYLCFVLDFRGKTFCLSLFGMMLAVDFLYMTFIMLRYVSSIPTLLRVLLGMDVEFCKCFFSIVDMVIYFLFFILLMFYIDCFADVEPSFYPWNKSHLIMVCDSFNMLLNLVCYCSVESFCIYVYQGCWPVIFFFSCNVLV